MCQLFKAGLPKLITLQKPRFIDRTIFPALIGIDIARERLRRFVKGETPVRLLTDNQRELGLNKLELANKWT